MVEKDTVDVFMLGNVYVDDETGGIVLACNIVFIRSNGAVNDRDNIPANAPDNNKIHVGVSLLGSSGSASEEGPTVVRNHV